jgi:carbon-monoxide dehydrogenase medium subunit
VIPTSFEFARATSIDDALARMQAAGGNGKFVAGGHSLVPLMKLRLSAPPLLIDVSRIPGLAGIHERDGRIVIGAGTVHHDVASSALLQQKCPIVADCAATIGDPQVRNRGTLGGSLAHADPSADMPAVMVALDADINLHGPKGARTVKAPAFFQGLFTVNLAPDELVVSVAFAPAALSAYEKLHQRASHYAVVGVGAVIDASGGTIAAARVGLTGATTHAVRLAAVERALAGTPLSAASIEAAAAHAADGIADVNADLHASAEYRRAMIPVFTRRALMAAMARA